MTAALVQDDEMVVRTIREQRVEVLEQYLVEAACGVAQVGARPVGALLEVLLVANVLAAGAVVSPERAHAEALHCAEDALARHRRGMREVGWPRPEKMHGTDSAVDVPQETTRGKFTTSCARV